MGCAQAGKLARRVELAVRIDVDAWACVAGYLVTDKCDLTPKSGFDSERSIVAMTFGPLDGRAQKEISAFY